MVRRPLQESVYGKEGPHREFHPSLLTGIPFNLMLDGVIDQTAITLITNIVGDAGTLESCTAQTDQKGVPNLLEETIGMGKEQGGPCLLMFRTWREKGLVDGDDKLEGSLGGGDTRCTALIVGIHDFNDDDGESGRGRGGTRGKEHKR